MPAARKRENRENQFYNVGEQGRKTGIRLEDKGLRDEYGMEPVSGIFSSPAKSPPKRSDRTVTESESMDIQESSIPNFTPGHILRNSRTSLPPPRSRSPMKTALGSSPRRQSSMGPRVQSNNADRAVSRRLDFEQEESALQETPALSGSGTRRKNPRRSIYDVEESPAPGQNASFEESMIQEEITANEDADMGNGYAEESFAGIMGDDFDLDVEAGANDMDGSVEEEQEPVVKLPTRRGTRKRKSDDIESTAEEESIVAQPRKRKTTAARTSGAGSGRKTAKQTAAKPRARPTKKRVSEVTEEEPSITADTTADSSIEIENPPTPPPARSRGRQKKTQRNPSNTDDVEQVVERAAPATKHRGKPAKSQVSKESDDVVFKKPKAPSKSKDKVIEKESEMPPPSAGKLVNAQGLPLSKTELDQISTTTAGSRYGRGRSLSVFRQHAPEELARTGRSGRHRLKPVDFWKNERAEYQKDGSLAAVVRNESLETPPRHKAPAKGRGKKRTLATVDEDEEDELEDWEEIDGVFTGIYRDYNPATETTSDSQIEETLAWGEKGIIPQDVPGAGFKFTKLANAPNSFFSWGCIELPKDGMKRTKNSRRMHMAFLVMKGGVEVNVNENIFTVHKGGIWQVPRGNAYSIRNVAKGESRLFFSQAFESTAVAED